MRLQLLFFPPPRKESCRETVTFFSETLACGEKKVGSRTKSRIASRISEMGQLPRRAVVDSAGHTVITRYMLVMAVLAAAVFTEKQIGLEAEVTNDLM